MGNAHKLLNLRYFQPGEDWQDLCFRVSRAVGAHEPAPIPSYYERMLKRCEFLPNSPCLMGAGTPLQQLAACFVLPIEDNMESIMQTVKDAAMVHKSGGGTGFNFSALRATNQPVNSTQGVASGPVSFMKIFDATTEQIKQGGRRKGANMAILRCDHPDIRRFLNAKLCEGNLTNFNLSVGITQELMKCETIDLVDPSTKKVTETVDSRQLLEEIALAAWRNGEPGIIFLDTVNQRRPMNQIEKMEATNPCGEFPGIDNEPCILGSINMAEMFNHRGEIDLQKIRHTTALATRFLDDVIDVNNYPLEKIDQVAKANRKIGLGMMGLHDALMKIGVPYDSSEGRDWAALLMQQIQETSHSTSANRARTLGEPPKVNGWRNMTTTAIAPTGSLSLIAGTTTGVEPVFALAQQRFLSDNQHYIEHNAVYEETLSKHAGRNRDSLDAYLQDVFKTASEIHWKDHIRMQAALQRHVDNGVSKTINLPNSARPGDVLECIRFAYGAGCKGITIYRSGSRDEQPVCELCS